MCTLSLEGGIALNCLVKKCKTGFPGRETTASSIMGVGKLLVYLGQKFWVVVVCVKVLWKGVSQ